jgi:hypothetical protein
MLSDLAHFKSSDTDCELLLSVAGRAPAATTDNALPSTSYTLTGPTTRESMREDTSPLELSHVSHTQPGGTTMISPSSLAMSSSPVNRRLFGTDNTRLCCEEAPATAATRRMPRDGALLFAEECEDNAHASRGRGGEVTATISPTRTGSSTQSDRNKTA